MDRSSVFCSSPEVASSCRSKRSTLSATATEMSADNPEAESAPSAAAERMRRYRKRRRLGTRQVKVDDALVQMRFVRKEDRRDDG